MSLRSRLPLLYRAYLRAPDHPAKLRLLNWLEPWMIPAKGGVFEVEHGLKMLLHPRETTEHALLRNDEYEPLTISFLERNLSAGQTTLLAGVNSGLHLMVASRAVGPTGCAIGVEPQPGSLRRARENVLLNALPDNIRLVSGGLGAGPAIVPMSEPPEDHTGWGSMVLREPGRHPYHIQIESVPNVLRHLKVERLDVMLLDVEGFELPVLEGMRDGIKPQVLILEVHPVVIECLGRSVGAYFDAAAELGYECFTLYGLPAAPGTPLPENNLIAVQRGARRPAWC